MVQVPHGRLTGLRCNKNEVFCLNLKAGKKLMSQFKTVKKKSLARGLAFSVLFRPSTDVLKPTHIREDNLLYSSTN